MLSSNLCLILLALFGASLTDNVDCPNIISRSSWGGKEPKKVTSLPIPLSYVIIHHTVTQECSSLDTCAAKVRNIQSYHMNNLGWDDIGYSFLIGGDGNVYEGRGWTKAGAHTAGWNNKSVAIAFIGNYQDVEPSLQMLDAARKLIACGKSQIMLRDDVKVLGARQVRSTVSPGDKLYSHVQNWPEWSPTP